MKAILVFLNIPPKCLAFKIRALKLRTTCFLSGLLMTIYFQVSCLFSLFVLADCPEPVRAR